MRTSSGARLRWAAAAMVVAVALVTTVALGRRTYCLADCRGPLLDCAETDRIMRRAMVGDEASRRRVVRLRTVLDGVNPIACGDVLWNVDTLDWGVGDAMRRATAHQQPVTLTLRFGGLVADAPDATLEVLGLEVRGFDDWKTALAVLLDLEQEPPWEADFRTPRSGASNASTAAWRLRFRPRLAFGTGVASEEPKPLGSTVRRSGGRGTWR